MVEAILPVRKVDPIMCTLSGNLNWGSAIWFNRMGGAFGEAMLELSKG